MIHVARHIHAAELAPEGVPMTVIHAQLGHSNLGTTSRYLAHIAPAEVIRVMQGREWEVQRGRPPAFFVERRTLTYFRSENGSELTANVVRK